MKFEKFIEIIEEGVFDPAILKAVFLAGGPGAGKSTIASRTTGGLGFKTLNSDEVFEYLMTKKGYGKEFIQMPAGSTLATGSGRGSKLSSPQTISAKLGGYGVKLDLNRVPVNVYEPARDIAKREIEKRVPFKSDTKGTWSDIGRLGLIIDATSDELPKIKSQRERLQALGYDTLLIYVKTTLDTSLRRNAQRTRSVAPDVVKNIWKKVRWMGGEDVNDPTNRIKNQYRDLFGANNYYEIDNDLEVPSEKDEASKKLWVQIMKFAQRPVQNPIGKNWMADQLKKRQR